MGILSPAFAILRSVGRKLRPSAEHLKDQLKKWVPPYLVKSLGPHFDKLENPELTPRSKGALTDELAFEIGQNILQQATPIRVRVRVRVRMLACSLPLGLTCDDWVFLYSGELSCPDPSPIQRKYQVSVVITLRLESRTRIPSQTRIPSWTGIILLRMCHCVL